MRLVACRARRSRRRRGCRGCRQTTASVRATRRALRRSRRRRHACERHRVQRESRPRQIDEAIAKREPVRPEIGADTRAAGWRRGQREASAGARRTPHVPAVAGRQSGGAIHPCLTTRVVAEASHQIAGADICEHGVVNEAAGGNLRRPPLAVCRGGVAQRGKEHRQRGGDGLSTHNSGVSVCSRARRLFIPPNPSPICGACGSGTHC